MKRKIFWVSFILFILLSIIALQAWIYLKQLYQNDYPIIYRKAIYSSIASRLTKKQNEIRKKYSLLTDAFKDNTISRETLKKEFIEIKKAFIHNKKALETVTPPKIWLKKHNECIEAFQYCIDAVDIYIDILDVKSEEIKKGKIKEAENKILEYRKFLSTINFIQM